MSSDRPYSRPGLPGPGPVPDEDIFADDDDLFGDGHFGEDFFDNDDYDSLVLPPINPNHSYDLDAGLPSFDDASFFDALPRLSSNDSFLPELSARSSATSANTRPPRSSQQAHRQPVSQYQVATSDSPDLFDDFLEFTPQPADMPHASNVATRSSSVVDLTESSPVQMAPAAARKRKRDSPGDGKTSNARRPSGSRSRSTSTKREDLGKVDLVDLSAVDNDEQYKDFTANEEARRAKEQADLIKAQNLAEANKPVKLAEFMCIICMDNPTDLTVTHCGHLFCSECLHSALHAGDKKCCPVCRTIINIKPTSNGKQSKNGIFPLEMKLMTQKKKGKQPVRAQ